MNVDKAGEAYWSEMWEGSELNPPLDKILADINNYPHKKFHQYFKKIFSNMSTQGMSLLEVGCGNSAWLPYFAREYGFRVSGIDYSEVGCEQARKILLREGVAGSVYCADFFSPPAELSHSFDVVISMGVVEHFSDTAEVLKVFSGFLKKGGILITTVPNFSGMRGYVQKKFHPHEYDIHVPLTKDHLEKATVNAGLAVKDIRYLTSFSFPMKLNEQSPYFKWQRMSVLTLCRIAKLIWLIENITGLSFPEVRSFSADIMCVAKKDQ